MNIVFDLGGVVTRWEPDAIVANVFTDSASQSLVRKEIIGHADWIELDRGTLPLQDAIARAARRTGLAERDVTRFFREVPPALVAMTESVELLYRLKAQGHALFCLSNMHVASIEHLERAYTFWEVFRGIVISCRVNLCKPEPAIYSHLLERYALNGPATVFIDDTQENLTAAERFGMQTIKFESAARCEQRLSPLAESG